MRKFVAEEWFTFITKVEAMNKDAKSKVRPVTKCSDGFDVKIVSYLKFLTRQNCRNISKIALSIYCTQMV